MNQLAFRAMLFRVMRNLKRNPQARGRNQEAKGEAVALLVHDPLLSITEIFRTTAAVVVVCAEGVLGLLASLTDERRVDQEDEFAPLALFRQQRRP